MKLIQFGAQNGCSKAGNTIRPYQIKLNEIFFNPESESGLKTLDGMSIVFRVSGKNQDFGSEGAEYLEKSKGRKFITIDFAIPQSRWQDMAQIEFAHYLVKGIEECFSLLINFAVNMNEIEDKDVIKKEFYDGMELFKQAFIEV